MRAKLQQAAATLEVHAVEEQYGAVTIEIERTAEALEQRDRTALWTVSRENPAFWFSCVAMQR